MARKRLFPVVASAAFLALTSIAARADIDVFSFGFRPPADREISIDLHSREAQSLTHDLVFRVEEASVKDRQLWVIGEVENASGTTYTQVRLVVGVEHGAEQRLTLGKLAGHASRRVQARLATEFEHAPPTIWVRVVEAKTDYRPKPYRW